MKPTFLIVLYLSLAGVTSAEGPRTPRPLDALAAETFVQAMAGSALVRDLVRQLESSDLVVHIVSSRQMPAGLGGTTRLVTSRGGYRYVRIVVGVDLRAEDRAAVMGHELQHACEVAASDAHDADGMRRLYQAAGHRPTANLDIYETKAALMVERQVRAQLRAEPGDRHRR